MKKKRCKPNHDQGGGEGVDEMNDAGQMKVARMKRKKEKETNKQTKNK